MAPRVAIVDPNDPGTGASFGNAGIVVNTKTRPVFAGLTAGSLPTMLRDPSPVIAAASTVLIVGTMLLVWLADTAKRVAVAGKAEP